MVSAEKPPYITFFLFFIFNRQIYPLERIFSLYAQIARPSAPPPSPPPLQPRSILIKTRPPRPSKLRRPPSPVIQLTGFT